jgi:hypothetical protein
MYHKTILWCEFTAWRRMALVITVVLALFVRGMHAGDHSAAIDRSVGTGRRRVGLLLGSCLSPPLALAANKHKNITRLFVHTGVGTTSLCLFGTLV